MIMKKTCFSPLFIIYMLFLLLFLSFNSEATKENKFPRPVGAVNDYASVLSPKVKAAMEGLSREILQKQALQLWLQRSRTLRKII